MNFKCLSFFGLVSTFGYAEGVFQSGPNLGNTYAASILYDNAENKLYLTGITYGTGADAQSSCFVATVSMDELDAEELSQMKTLGSSNILETCSNLALQKQSNVVLIGNSERGGMYASDAISAEMSGFVVALDKNTLTEVDGETLMVGDEADRIPFPVATVVDGDDFYIVSLKSDDSSPALRAPSGDQPNWINYPKYGSTYDMDFLKVQLKQKEINGIEDDLDFEFSNLQLNEFPVNQEPDGSFPRVFIGGIVLKKTGSTGFVVIAGSTRGKGRGYGDAAGDDEDGFITLLDLETGKLVTDRKNQKRFGTAGEATDDEITGICDDPNDPESVYIVGASKGDWEKGDIQNGWLDITSGSLQGFISKIDLTTLDAEWTIELGARDGSKETTAYAVGCSVADGVVYVAGEVTNGARMVLGTQTLDSMGGTDVWIAQVETADGYVNWLNQVGTSGEDTLARNGPVVTVDDGDAVLFGNTNGNMFRQATDGVTNLFLAQFAKEDGTYYGGEAAQNLDPTAEVPVPTPTSSPPGDTSVVDSIIGVQSGPDVGPTYAGGMVYDRVTDVVYLTGSTYGSFGEADVKAKAGSSCFLGVMRLPELEWQERKTYGSSHVAEACNSLALHQSEVVVVGSAESGGLLTQLSSDEIAIQYGLAMDLSSANDEFDFLGGALLDAAQVQFPVAVVESNSHVLIASMASNETNKITADEEKVNDKKYPNLTTGGIQKYGFKFNLLLESYKRDRLPEGDTNVIQETMHLKWRKHFGHSDMESIFVSGLISLGPALSTLVVVGSTLSKGDENNMDGMMVRLQVAPNGNADGTGSSQMANGSDHSSVNYFASASEQNDWILNACTDPLDMHTFFIVGGTRGEFDDSAQRQNGDVTVHAFVSKIDLDSLTAIWTKQFAVNHASGSNEKRAAAVALGCDVLAPEHLIYVAGNVENGATLVSDTGDLVSAGGDDIFVAQLDTIDGTLKWLKQFGSNGDDRLARGGGIKVDGTGNALLYGDTNGSMYRDRQNEQDSRFSDLFTVMVRKDGVYATPLKVSTKVGTDTSAPSEWYPGSIYTGSTRNGVTILGITVLVMAITGAGLWFYQRRRTRKEADTLDFTEKSFEDDEMKTKEGIHLPGNHHKTYSDLHADKDREVV